MKVLHVVETNEFGDDFELVGGKWKVKFPPPPAPTYELSVDENNAIVLDGNQTIHLDKAKLFAYIMVQNDIDAKVYLYRYQAGTEFSVETATQVGAADMVELNALIDNITITDAVIEFNDINSGNALVLNTNLFQKVDGITTDLTTIANNYIDPETGNTTQLAVKVAIQDGNILQETVAGLFVDVSEVGVPLVIQQQLEAIEYMDAPINEGRVYDSLEHTITGAGTLSIPLTTLVNARGKALCSIVKPLTAKIPLPVE